MPVSLLRCLLLATVLTTAPLLARAEIIELPFSMAKGEVLELTVTSRTDQTRGGREQWKESFETGTVEVIDLLDDGYLVEMTLLESRHDASQSVMKDMALAMADGLNGRAVRFELNENGLPVRVIDWRELLDDIASIARESTSADRSPELQQALDMVFKQFSAMDETTAATVFGKNIYLWTSWHGQVLDTENPVSETVEGVHPLTGQPLVLTLDTSVARFDNRTAQLDVIQVADPDDLRKNLRIAYEKLIPDADVRAQVLEMLETDPPELKFEQSYEFDRASGRARRMTQVQTIAMGVLASQEERREITVRRR